MTGHEPLDDELAQTLRATAPASTSDEVRTRLVVARAARRRGLRRAGFGAGIGVMLLIALVVLWPTPPTVQRATHMLVIQEQLADRLAAAPAERQRRGREFGAWVEDLRRRGMLTGGQQLTADGGHAISAAGVDDRSGSTPPGEVVSGFLLVHATDDRDVLTAARDCPIVAYGGRVMVRRLAR